MYRKIFNVIYEKLIYIIGLMLYNIVGLSATIASILLTKYEEIKTNYSNRKGIKLKKLTKNQRNKQSRQEKSEGVPPKLK